MNQLIIAVILLDIVLAFISAVPCLLACASSLDNPNTRENLINQILGMTFLTFPVVCLVCPMISGITSCYSKKVALFVAAMPWLEFSLIIIFLKIYGMINGE